MVNLQSGRRNLFDIRCNRLRPDFITGPVDVAEVRLIKTRNGIALRIAEFRRQVDPLHKRQGPDVCTQNPVRFGNLVEFAAARKERHHQNKRSRGFLMKCQKNLEDSGRGILRRISAVSFRDRELIRPDMDDQQFRLRTQNTAT